MMLLGLSKNTLPITADRECVFFIIKLLYDCSLLDAESSFCGFKNVFGNGGSTGRNLRYELGEVIVSCGGTLDNLGSGCAFFIQGNA